MNPTRALHWPTRILAGAAALLVARPAATAADGITAVYSRVSDDYSRASLADGSFQAETYAFGKGGYYGAAISDDTIDNVSFADVAHVVAGPLAGQNFIPGKDPGTTRLLIMVYWGATNGSMDFSASRLSSGDMNSWETGSMRRAVTDAQNAALLGYGEELSGFGLKARREQGDLLNEVGYSRYFVVLMAYDFQLMWKNRQHKLLWEARFSIREQGNDFTVALPAMAQYASVYFGRDSHGLLRARVADGRIYMGDPTLVEYLFEPKK